MDDRVVARFWAKVKKTNNCWIWTGGLNDSGHGRFYIVKKYTLAHRFSWFLVHGHTKFCVLHKCNNARCVNPAHLYEGTQMDNIRDKWAAETKRQGPSGWSVIA